MNAIDSAREDRSRNLARLRRLTIGTAALGVAATTGFGYVAAMTYTGATSIATTAAVTTGTSGTRGTTAATSSSIASTGSTSSSTSTAPTVSAVSGTAHVSSGGS